VPATDGEGDAKPGDDDDDDVFASLEDSAEPFSSKVDSKRRSQSLSALTNDNSSSQAPDATVSVLCTCLRCCVAYSDEETGLYCICTKIGSQHSTKISM